MIAMLMVGRLLRVVDARLLILGGLALTTWSLYDMTGFSTDMDAWPVVLSGVMQGFGLGFVFVPMSTVGFATLAPQLRTESAALYSLVRNIGSSIGISVVTSMLSRNIQINHAELGEHLTPLSPELDAAAHAVGMHANTLTFSSILDNIVQAQAAMISYVDDFKLMMWVTLLVLPLILVLRKPPKSTEVKPSMPDAD